MLDLGQPMFNVIFPAALCVSPVEAESTFTYSNPGTFFPHADVLYFIGTTGPVGCNTCGGSN
jgi:hypothetical protein